MLSLLEKLCRRDEASGKDGRYILRYGMLGDYEGWLIELIPWQENAPSLFMIPKDYPDAVKWFDHFTKDYRGRLPF